MALAMPAGAGAATTTFGSPLSVPATLNAADNLGYAGTNIPYSTTVVHVNHDGADTALWNPTLAGGMPTAPAAGQILSVAIEGCAKPAPGGPPPLTQFHVQSLTPLAGGGGVTVDVTSQPFDLPVCGTATTQGAIASGSTVTNYQPTNMCVSAGDYVDFNDEGGFDPQFYPSGVPYQVIGSVPGSTMNSYIDDNGTNNGDALSAMNVAAMNGFATNRSEELMLQATLGTGSDSISACTPSTGAGGSAGSGSSGGSSGGGGAGGSSTGTAGGGGASPPTHHHPGPGQPGGSPGVVVKPRTEDVIKRRVSVAFFCAQRQAPCGGTLTLARATLTLASRTFASRADATAHVPLRLSAAAARFVRRAGHRGVKTTLTVTLAGQAPVQATITLKAP